MFKKTFFLIALFSMLTGCYQSTASLIGPTVTLGTSGNLAQSALSYSVNESVKKATGKYPAAHIKESFKIYQDRIKRNNNILLMRIIYYLSPLSFFRPVYIFLKDYGKTFEIDYVQNRFRFSTKEPMLSMQSESLMFIFKNQFGFDTLNVNSRFEEVNKLGWSTASRTLTIETLNNLGFKVNFGLFFNRKIIFLFFRTFFKVIKNLK